MFKNDRQFLVRMKKRLGTNAQAKVKRSMGKSANLVRNEAVQSIIQNARTGPVVTRRGIRMNISAAGDPPASDTGFLASQISSEVKTRGSEVIGIVTSAAPYSAPLEFGTTNMAERPFLQPALRKSKDKIEAIFKREGII